MLGEEEAKRLCQQVLTQCECQAAEVLLLSKELAATRFANNAIQKDETEHNISLILRIMVGKRIGTASAGRLDEESIAMALSRAWTNAQTNPEEAEAMSLPGPAQYMPVEAFDQTTADYAPEKRAEAVREICALAENKTLTASGIFETGSEEVTVVNSAGLVAYYASTKADFETIVTGGDSSGRAHASAWRAEDLQAKDLGKEAVDNAWLGRKPKPIDPGTYTLVAGPHVVEDMLQMLNYHGMSAQDVDEGRSWMNDRIGQQAMDEQVSIWDDGLDPQGLPMPFDFEGVPKQRVEIVQNGVVTGPVYDRQTALRQGKIPTGHAMPPTFRGMRALAGNLFMEAGEASLEEMIHSTEKGLYVTGFWYTHLMSAKGCLVTGMTRDGAFLIEKGKITHPVKDLCFTQSYVEALKNVEMVGKERRLVASKFGGISLLVPAVKIRNFNLVGLV